MAFSGSMVAGNESPQAMDPEQQEIGGPVLLGKATQSKDPSQGRDKLESQIEAKERQREIKIELEYAELNAMADVLLNWPAFGAFSIFMCHRNVPGPEGLVFKFWALSIILVQVVVPVGLFVAQYHSYNKGWCPSTGSPSQRVLMSCIALFYFVRSTLTLVEKCEQTMDKDEYETSSENLGPWPDENEKMRVKRRETGVEDSILADYGLIDTFMDNAYESLVLLLNLWLVFIADGALDIVLDSLAMEFVGKIDDEFKARVFAGRGARVFAKKILNQQLHKQERDAKWLDTCWQCMCTTPLLVLTVVSFVMFFYGAACKH